MPPEPTGGTPTPESATPTGGTQEGGNAGAMPVITPELQAIIDAEKAKATKKANEEAAASRLELKALKDKQKAEEEAKMAENNQFKELAERHKAELAAAQAERDALLPFKQQAEEFAKQRHEELLKKIPEAQRDFYKDFTTAQLETVAATLSATLNGQGSERQGGQQQPQRVTAPTVPFAGHNSDIQQSLLKILGG